MHFLNLARVIKDIDANKGDCFVDHENNEFDYSKYPGKTSPKLLTAVRYIDLFSISPIILLGFPSLGVPVTFVLFSICAFLLLRYR